MVPKGHGRQFTNVYGHPKRKRTTFYANIGSRKEYICNTEEPYSVNNSVGQRGMDAMLPLYMTLPCA